MFFPLLDESYYIDFLGLVRFPVECVFSVSML